MSGLKWDKVRQEQQARRPVAHRDKPATAKQRKFIRSLAEDRGVRPQVPVATMTLPQAKQEIDRLKALPREFASDRQREFLERLAEERGVELDLGERLTAKAFDRELPRLKAMPKVRVSR